MLSSRRGADVLRRTDIAEGREPASRSAFLSRRSFRSYPGAMEVPAEDDSSSSPNVMYKAAHQAFRDRWKETDDTMCRHSMSFHLHHTLRSEFFASYLYLMEKIPLGTSG